jgi:hypothetical protein
MDDLKDEDLKSYARAEAALGSDADEAKYRAALRSRDNAAIIACEDEAAARVAAFDQQVAAAPLYTVCVESNKCVTETLRTQDLGLALQRAADSGGFVQSSAAEGKILVDFRPNQE